jgi:predicted ribosome quality control (RQC) complex YloA/Tae2 family protein
LGNFAGAALTTGDNNIDIGNNVLGVAGESNTIRIGNTDITDTFISGISGTTVASGAAVLVDSSGHLGTVTSSKRFKDNIKPMDKASEVLLALKPVTFRYKKEIDPAGISQFGLIAEEVAKVNPALVLTDKEGKPYTVRYEAVNAMLLNEFLKEHEKTEKLEATVASLIATVKEQAAQIQKVSAQLEASKPAPQVVNNP